MKQVTLNDSFSVKGKGLHTGLEIEASFYPAPENHGYKFQRIDLEGEPTIDALAEFVTATTRGTVISRGDVSVSTIEHALAALYAAGIDNCLIKLNAPEMPILDGSASEYCNKIAEVGTIEQKEEKDYYIVKHKLEVKDEESPLILGRSMMIRTELVKIENIPMTEDADMRVCVDGEILDGSIDTRDIKDEKVILMFNLFDGTSTIGCKAFLQKT